MLRSETFRVFYYHWRLPLKDRTRKTEDKPSGPEALFVFHCAHLLPNTREGLVVQLQIIKKTLGHKKQNPCQVLRSHGNGCLSWNCYPYRVTAKWHPYTACSILGFPIVLGWLSSLLLTFVCLCMPVVSSFLVA